MLFQSLLKLFLSNIYIFTILLAFIQVLLKFDCFILIDYFINLFILNIIVKLYFLA